MKVWVKPLWKFGSSHFKGLRFQKAEPFVALRRERNPPCGTFLFARSPVGLSLPLSFVPATPKEKALNGTAYLHVFNVVKPRPNRSLHLIHRCRGLTFLYGKSLPTTGKGEVGGEARFAPILPPLFLLKKGRWHGKAVTEGS